MQKILRLTLQHTRLMASFSQVINPMTGQNTWHERGDDYDYHQEVANAGFGDMLHDWERNQKYYAALRKTIAAMRQAGKQVHVLDIGTGTGILAMMALRAGADTVTACEAFMPMANCAARILASNDAAQVRLIRKRSTDIQMGIDMPHRANLLVAELLDTELIGEGAIGIYNHAHQELLTEDALCIPARATCYAQVAQSPLAAQWNSLKVLPNLDGDILLRPPAQLLECNGEAALHDVQLSQLPPNSFHTLTEPAQIFQFDFQRKQPREQQREHVLRLQLSKPGSVELVFYWWQIELDDAGEQLLSCAPYWAHPELHQLQKNCKNAEQPLPNIVPWRDHWMQAIYYIPKPLQLQQAGEQFWLRCYHDEYSLWFDAHKEQPEQPARRHSCSCDLHMTYTRNRIGQLNQGTRNKRYLAYLEQAVQQAKPAHVLVMGDGCLLGLASSALGAGSVRCLEPHRFSRRLLESVSKHNKLKNVRFLENLQQLEPEELKTLTHIFAEPYFLNAILPWDNFYFGTLLLQLQQQQKLPESVEISPCAARIYALPVQFLDLHKIRTPIINCEGFDLTLFDEMVQRSAKQALSQVEAQPLWEYPCRALAEPQQLLSVNFANFGVEQHNQGCLELTTKGNCNGVALWVDWQLAASNSSKSIVSSGPLEPVVPGQFVKWDMFVRQGVHFTSQTDNQTHLHWSTTFRPLLGELSFNFSLQANREESK
ncbi:protein arginine N-methyltransferase 7 isoform X1 [Drosophila montana]|uniref:protein arginine N-methyltransferase 7 isoform X1 n=2 Tax=Drosophila montana TaxID=40370 RepID=UPI00313B94BC